MRKLLFCIMLLCCMCVNAQNTLVVHCKSGETINYAFSEKPVVTYIDDGVHISTSKVEVDYPYSNLEMFTFSENADGIGQIRTTGAQGDGTMYVYTVAGTLVKTVKGANGESTFSTDDLPKGIYIVKNNTVSYKIIKR